jgi:hypothetical protein
MGRNLAAKKGGELAGKDAFSEIFLVCLRKVVVPIGVQPFWIKVGPGILADVSVEVGAIDEAQSGISGAMVGLWSSLVHL